MTIKEFNNYMEQHKKLWYEIAGYLYNDADKDDEGITVDIENLKRAVLYNWYRKTTKKIIFDEYCPPNLCFACKCAKEIYDEHKNHYYKLGQNYCHFCPLEWYRDRCYDSEYDEIDVEAGSGFLREAAELAEDIAELPIKKEFYSYLKEKEECLQF